MLFGANREAASFEAARFAKRRYALQVGAARRSAGIGRLPWELPLLPTAQNPPRVRNVRGIVPQNRGEIDAFVSGSRAWRARFLSDAATSRRAKPAARAQCPRHSPARWLRDRRLPRFRGRCRGREDAPLERRGIGSGRSIRRRAKPAARAQCPEHSPAEWLRGRRLPRFRAPWPNGETRRPFPPERSGRGFRSARRA